MDGYVVIDSEMMFAYKGIEPYNKLIDGEFHVFKLEVYINGIFKNSLS
ncbi:hypothetical protein [uncultured Clostridium sp.]|nr:hypothetical protein [uncultured Clostridium sp.]